MKLQLVDSKENPVKFGGVSTGELIPESEHKAACKEPIFRLDDRKGFLCVSTIKRHNYRVLDVQTGEIVDYEIS
jgi:hypothetical protein